MDTRPFGKTDLRVSTLGLGCARLGGIFQRDSSGFLDLLSTALDAGITFYDTADIYSQGESESLLGRAFRGRRDRVVLASKAGYRLPGRRRLASQLKPLLRPVIRALRLRRDRLPAAVRGSLAQDFTPSYLVRAIEGSLRRLRTDYLDLFQLHSPAVEVVELGDWLPTLERLKAQGKIRYFGVSCDTVEAGRAALRWPGVSSIQVLLNLLERKAAAELVAPARERGVAVIARECLANGLLVKDAAQVDLKAYCRSPEEEARRAQQLDLCRSEALAAGCSVGELALRFVTGLEGVSVALIGARSVEQLEALLRLSRG
jgi:aryl-alcohol dehydrogenase-like predicted oxidoreductase